MSSLFLKKLKNFFILLFSSSDALRLEKYFFFTLIRLLRQDLRHFGFNFVLSANFLKKIRDFFYCVSFFTKISTKNRVIWILPFFEIQGIIITLSAAPTPQHHAQRSIVLAEYQAYDINAQACQRLCFFNPIRQSLSGVFSLKF